MHQHFVYICFTFKAIQLIVQKYQTLTQFYESLYAKRSIQIYILIFSFIFLSEIVCFIVHLCIQIFVYFSDFFLFYYSHKSCVDVQHGTSDLLPLRRHVPMRRAEPNSKRLLMTSQAATRYMWLKLLYQLSLLSD